jgi:asparagine synthase (glutamine-hydrolysing)
LRSHTPVIAELSGGLDSSSIVCVADHLAAEEGAKPLETISFFDDTEPNWNERPYFAAVESRRGQTGFHLNVSGDGRLIPERDGSFPSTPAHGARPSGPQRQLANFLAKGGYRVLLSGIGGDEFTGGVPTGIPELADLLRRGDIPAFVHRAFLWAMASRKPLVHVVGKTLRSFLPTLWASASRAQWPMPWLTRSFVRRNQRTLRSHLPRFHWSGGSPAFQENLHALDGLRRQIACAELAPCPGYEKRYPFLDRDLLQFLFAVPRDQLVRPHHRRSLLRRALREIVPGMVLDRARKAYVATGLLKAIGSDWERVVPLTQGMLLESHRVVHSAVLRTHLENARRGAEAPLLPLLRVLRIEWWLRDPGLLRLIADQRCVPAEGLAVSHRTSGTA